MDLSSINVADIAVTLVILFSGLFAFFRGFVHEILAVASWVGAAAATLIVTTNTGCALRLAAGLREQDPPVAVCHPLEILAARLPQRLESDPPARQN